MLRNAVSHPRPPARTGRSRDPGGPAPTGGLALRGLGSFPPVSGLALLLVLALVSPATAGRDQFELEDTVAIVVLDRELVAHATDRGSSRLRLEVGEQLVWHGARGRIGFALTDRRLLGYSRVSGWTDRRLRVAEHVPDRAQLGSRIALFVTSQRAIAYDGQWREAAIGPQEAFRSSSVGSGAALVVTNRRALGLSPGSGGFVAAKLDIHERVESATTLASSAQITTSRRVLFFSGPSGSWTEQRRSKF